MRKAAAMVGCVSILHPCPGCVPDRRWHNLNSKKLYCSLECQTINSDLEKILLRNQSSRRSEAKADSRMVLGQAVHCTSETNTLAPCRIIRQNTPNLIPESEAKFALSCGQIERVPSRGHVL